MLFPEFSKPRTVSRISFSMSCLLVSLSSSVIERLYTETSSRSAASTTYVWKYMKASCLCVCVFNQPSICDCLVLYKNGTAYCSAWVFTQLDVVSLHQLHHPHPSQRLTKRFFLLRATYLRMTIAMCIERATALRANNTRVKREYKVSPGYSQLIN